MQEWDPRQERLPGPTAFCCWAVATRRGEEKGGGGFGWLAGSTRADSLQEEPCDVPVTVLCLLLLSASEPLEYSCATFLGF